MDRNPDTTTQIPTTRPANRRRMAFAAVAALLAVGAGAVAVGATGGGADDTTAATAPTTTSTTLLDDGFALIDDDNNAAPADNPQVDPQPPAPQPPAEQPPADQPPADEPPAPQADPGVLAVSKALIEMDPNTWTGSFQVRNEGASALDWQWVAGGSGITVSQSSGTLQPGEFVEIDFAIDHTELPKGEFNFPNTVVSGDQVKNVHIKGTKTVAKNPGIELPDPVIKP